MLIRFDIGSAWIYWLMVFGFRYYWIKVTSHFNDKDLSRSSVISHML